MKKYFLSTGFTLIIFFCSKVSLIAQNLDALDLLEDLGKNDIIILSIDKNECASCTPTVTATLNLLEEHFDTARIYFLMKEEPDFIIDDNIKKFLNKDQIDRYNNKIIKSNNLFNLINKNPRNHITFFKDYNPISNLQINYFLSKSDSILNLINDDKYIIKNKYVIDEIKNLSFLMNDLIIIEDKPFIFNIGNRSEYLFSLLPDNHKVNIDVDINQYKNILSKASILLKDFSDKEYENLKNKLKKSGSNIFEIKNVSTYKDKIYCITRVNYILDKNEKYEYFLLKISKDLEIKSVYHFPLKVKSKSGYQYTVRKVGKKSFMIKDSMAIFSVYDNKLLRGKSRKSFSKKHDLYTSAKFIIRDTVLAFQDFGKVNLPEDYDNYFNFQPIYVSIDDQTFLGTNIYPFDFFSIDRESDKPTFSFSSLLDDNKLIDTFYAQDNELAFIIRDTETSLFYYLLYNHSQKKVIYYQQLPVFVNSSWCITGIDELYVMSWMPTRSIYIHQVKIK